MEKQFSVTDDEKLTLMLCIPHDTGHVNTQKKIKFSCSFSDQISRNYILKNYKLSKKFSGTHPTISWLCTVVKSESL